ncbi:hypothetical protein T484DRAFT_1923786 [Baffinella frigidus]|nr:hypothetical protein T484DRAFT_1923786 [Cryptophyta sp. CCMP2293]
MPVSPRQHLSRPAPARSYPQAAPSRVSPSSEAARELQFPSLQFPSSVPKQSTRETNTYPQVPESGKTQPPPPPG